MPAIVKPERPGGFLDFLPADYLARERMLNTIAQVFRSYGFDPIETPRIEFLKTLAGEESDTGKNIFHIKSTTDNEPLAMPFDHTVPFARLLAANPFDSRRRSGIRLPWRRMAVGPVFRADSPQSGRYRQFYQFDADIAGTHSMLADAEIVAVMYQTLAAVGVERFILKLNNRKILNGLARMADVTARGEISTDDIIKEMMHILDKLDKIGLEAVLNQLQAAPESAWDARPHLSDAAIDQIRAYLSISGDNSSKLAACEEVFAGVDIALEGVTELKQVLDYLSSMRIPEAAVGIDLSIARGLDYYTGPVVETFLHDAPQFGSVLSGGRYNDLVKRFTGQELPAVGASIGVDRLFAALDHLNALDRTRRTVSEVMILNLVPERKLEYVALAGELRLLGLNTEVCFLEDTAFKGQFGFALNRGVKYAVICGENEFERGTVQIKNLETRRQTEVDREKIADYFSPKFA